MRCVYINLASETARRADLEANFLSCAGPGWSLARLEAVTPADVHAAGIGGILRPTEKACFVSHRNAVATGIGSEEPIAVFEDDIVLGPTTTALIDQALAGNPDLDWDILYLEVCISRMETMVELFRLRRHLAGQGGVTLINLQGVEYAGATAYIVHPKAQTKIVEIIAGLGELNVPYDVALRDLVRQGVLKGFAFFPFLSGFSDHVLTSQDQLGQTHGADRVWIAFRQLMQLDRDLQALRPTVEAIRRDLCDADAELFGLLLGAMLGPGFQTK